MAKRERASLLVRLKVHIQTLILWIKLSFGLEGAMIGLSHCHTHAQEMEDIALTLEVCSRKSHGSRNCDKAHEMWKMKE